jgi:Cys-tRNA(Pro)/Cys-tRNA(Cys) deacylase
MAKAAKGTPAVLALMRAKLAHRLHEYDFDGTPGQIGMQAAAAMGVEPARVFKTLMVVLDETELLVAVVPVDHELDLKALAKAAGGKRAAMADVAQAERATGYVKGGISPFGQKRRHRTFLDTAALGQPSIIVNGGNRGLQIELAAADLLAATGGVAATIARG